ncbi:MAG: TauD/TfdA family dioxygenase [Egibacteraceae bacterium]
MSAAWPPRLRLPGSASAALAGACVRWTLEELADSQFQRQALMQVCAQIPQLRETLEAARTMLRREGAVVVEGAPTHSPALAVAASAMGVVTADGNGHPQRLVWDVRPSSGAVVRSQGRDALPLHTDSTQAEHPHAVLCFGCVEPGQDGDGLSLLAPASRAVAALHAQNRAREVRLLQDPCFPFANDSADGLPVALRPILRRTEGDVCVRYHEKIVGWGVKVAPASLDPEHRTALETFQAALRQPSLATSLLLRANDFLLFDNHRVMPGRTAIDSTSNRHLKRLKLHDTRKES